jgi:protein-tyrosine phosphatase
VIDLHVHLLPALDDGPWNVPNSIEMADALVTDGVTTVAATPHLRADHPAVVPSELASRCEELAGVLRDVSIPLEVVPAAEVDLSWALDASQEDLRLASYGQRGEYVLIETPYGALPDNFEDLLFNAVTHRGMRPVLAHPERSPTFQRDLDRLRELVDHGVLMQITAPALVKKDRRSRSRAVAVALLEEGLCHVVASDAHSAGPQRPPALSEALTAASEIAPGHTEWMVYEMAPAILAGDPPPSPPAGTGRPKKRLLGALRR